MTRTEVALIGGGIYGCYVAWTLARRGVASLLVEAGEIAGGASGGVGRRGVRANGRDPRELPLMRAAYEIWPDLHRCIEAATGYERIGGLELIEDEVDLVGEGLREGLAAAHRDDLGHPLDARAVEVGPEAAHVYAGCHFVLFI